MNVGNVKKDFDPTRSISILLPKYNTNGAVSGRSMMEYHSLPFCRPIDNFSPIGAKVIGFVLTAMVQCALIIQFLANVAKQYARILKITLLKEFLLMWSVICHKDAMRAISIQWYVDKWMVQFVTSLCYAFLHSMIINLHHNFLYFSKSTFFSKE